MQAALSLPAAAGEGRSRRKPAREARSKASVLGLVREFAGASWEKNFVMGSLHPSASVPFSPLGVELAVGGDA